MKKIKIEDLYEIFKTTGVASKDMAKDSPSDAIQIAQTSLASLHTVAIAERLDEMNLHLNKIAKSLYAISIKR